MSTRPTTVPSWGEDELNDVAPSTSFRDDGWVTNAVLVSSYLNNWMKFVGRWAQFLADGVMTTAATAANQDVDADLSDGTYIRASGSFLEDGFAPGQTIQWIGFTNAGNRATKIIDTVTATIMTVTDPTGMVDEAGTGNESCVAWFSTAGDLESRGKLSVEGTAGFGDDVGIGGLLTVDGVIIAGSSIGAGGNITAGTNSDIIVNGTGRFKHGTFTLALSAIAFQPTTGAPLFSSTGEPTWTATGADTLYAAVHLPVGKRLLSAGFANTRSSGTLTFEVTNHDVNAGTQALVGAALSVAAGTTRVVSSVASMGGDADATLGANETFYLTASLGAVGNAFHGVILTFDEP